MVIGDDLRKNPTMVWFGSDRWMVIKSNFGSQPGGKSPGNNEVCFNLITIRILK